MNYKTRGIAYIFTLLGFFGFAGLQHLYLGKIFKGLLWFVTFGFLGVGTIIDLFTMGTQVDTYNNSIEIQELKYSL